MSQNHPPITSTTSSDDLRIAQTRSKNQLQRCRRRLSKAYKVYYRNPRIIRDLQVKVAAAEEQYVQARQAWRWAKYGVEDEASVSEESGLSRPDPGQLRMEPEPSSSSSAASSSPPPSLRLSPSPSPSPSPTNSPPSASSSSADASVPLPSSNPIPSTTRKRKRILSASTSAYLRSTRSKRALEEATNRVTFSKVIAADGKAMELEVEVPKVGEWLKDWKALQAIAQFSSTWDCDDGRIRVCQSIQQVNNQRPSSKSSFSSPPLLHVIRSYSRASETPQALSSIGFDLDSEIEWQSTDFRNYKQALSFRQALGGLNRLKCLGIRCLDDGVEGTGQVEVLRREVGCEPGPEFDWGFVNPLEKPARGSPEAMFNRDRQRERWQRNKQAIEQGWKDYKSDGRRRREDWSSVYDQSAPATPASCTAMYKSTMRWAIVNGKGTYSDWHQDAGGALTFFVVKSGRKLWMVKDVGAVILEAGDAVLMTPGVWHAVYTLENSVCIGGVGWHPKYLPATAKALMEESNRGSCETLPLWVPTITRLGVRFLHEATARTTGSMTLAETDEAIQHIIFLLSGNSYRFPGKRVQAKTGIYDKGKLVDYGREEVAGILKASLGEAAWAVEGLQRV